MKKQKLIVAVTGASGALYARRLFERLVELEAQVQEVGVIFSPQGKQVWEYELGASSFEAFPFSFYSHDNFFAPPASGSAHFDTMLVCPCSMGTLARVAQGVASDLTTRAADVMLKERRRLILLIREAPFSLIHLQNMTRLTQSGAVICPASPSFYSKPENFQDLADTVIDRLLDLAGFQIQTFRWMQPNESPAKGEKRF